MSFVDKNTMILNYNHVIKCSFPYLTLGDQNPHSIYLFKHLNKSIRCFPHDLEMVKKAVEIPINSVKYFPDVRENDIQLGISFEINGLLKNNREATNMRTFSIYFLHEGLTANDPGLNLHK